MASPLRTLRHHAAVARRCAQRYGYRPLAMFRALDQRPVFVIGSPRSGTSFTADAIGQVDGFADLGEVNALKAAIPHLYTQSPSLAARRVRRILSLDQRLGMVAGSRAIEQTPESTHIVPALAAAYPDARFIHLVRDGRDVVCSLIERGWLRDGTAGVEARATGTVADDAGQPFGDYVRFWVEPERRTEFAEVSEARRSAWAWRRYTEAALLHTAALPANQVLRVRYEEMAKDPAAAAATIAAFLDAQDRLAQFEAVISKVHARSLGRWRRNLTAAQIADIEDEAGTMLTELGYPLVATAAAPPQ